MDFTVNSKRSRTRKQLKHDLYRLALADESIRYASAACDLVAKVIIEWKGKTLPFISGDCLMASIAVFYARPFTYNDFPGILPKKWTRFSTPALQRAHEEMIECRHEIFAHCDPKIHTMSIIPAGVIFPKMSHTFPHISYTINSYTIPPTRVVFWHRTCKDLQKRLEAASFEMLETLYGTLDLPQRQFPLRFNNGL